MIFSQRKLLEYYSCIQSQLVMIPSMIIKILWVHRTWRKDMLTLSFLKDWVEACWDGLSNNHMWSRCDQTIIGVSGNIMRIYTCNQEALIQPVPFGGCSLWCCCPGLSLPGGRLVCQTHWCSLTLLTKPSRNIHIAHISYWHGFKEFVKHKNDLVELLFVHSEDYLAELARHLACVWLDMLILIGWSIHGAWDNLCLDIPPSLLKRYNLMNAVMHRISVEQKHIAKVGFD